MQLPPLEKVSEKNREPGDKYSGSLFSNIASFLDVDGNARLVFLNLASELVVPGSISEMVVFL